MCAALPSSLKVQFGSRTFDATDEWSAEEVRSTVGALNVAAAQYGADDCAAVDGLTDIFGAALAQLRAGAEGFALTGDIVVDLTATCSRLADDIAPSEVSNDPVPGGLGLTYGDLGARSQLVDATLSCGATSSASRSRAPTPT